MVTKTIIKLVQDLILAEPDGTPVTASRIGEKIDLALQLNPPWATVVDRSAVTEELLRRFGVRVGESSTLRNEEGHVAWLSAARKRNGLYWQRYVAWLERALPHAAIEAMDATTDQILGLLEDPLREGRWDRRGLVVGHVQSGKTGNYTGLINKAADAGYKIIIVLAGLHNNLRAQTQMRLDEGFLGYETRPLAEELRVIGVGEIDRDPAIRPNFATNRSESGDFTTAVARNLGITPEQRPWLFVVKKNRTVLEQLYQWIRNHVADLDDQRGGRRIVTKLPLLLIDDEADHASVDTGEQVFDAEDRPDPEHEPTAINRRIRLILSSFARAAYVGYTATPFANIFIHERAATREEGPDLFPSAFIINLAAPSSYIGPERVFGKATTEGRQGGLPLVRTVVDQDIGAEGVPDIWMPPVHRNGHVPRHKGMDTLPPSLIEAIDAFLLACCVRRARGQRSNHCSMLVHVTRYNSVQAEVRRQIETHLHQMRQRLKRGIDDRVLLERIRRLWDTDFLVTSSAMRAEHPELVDSALPDWGSVLRELPEVLQDVEARSINGTAKDALDYSGGQGLTLIAVGGDKLARGLTLEGLTTSYFLRASRMYDTLMQMGRWFGYRPGYVDVCRLYTTGELIDWFGHITDAAQELREEFELMAASGATPREYGLRVQSHPVLLVTSRLKMRAARDMMLSFSGELLETVALYSDPVVLASNLEACKRLISSLGKPDEGSTIVRTRSAGTMRWQGFLWRSAAASEVIEFLRSYRTHPDAYKVRSHLLAEFIESMNEAGELTEWNVALIGAAGGRPCSLSKDISVEMIKRQNERQKGDRFSIGRLLSPRDESIDLDESPWNAALEATRSTWKSDPARPGGAHPPDEPSGPHIRSVRGFGAPGIPPSPQRGLLLLYVLDPEKAKLVRDTPVAAFGLSFPGSKAGRKVLYKVNHVQWRLWGEEHGAGE